jgi:hypothetical protein
MHKQQSRKEIENMSATERWCATKEKLSNKDNRGAVPALLNHIRIHENSRWLNYRPHLAEQVPSSDAAHAFHSLQVSNLHYEGTSINSQPPKGTKMKTITYGAIIDHLWY